jgi:membrane protease subunit HflK
MPWSNQSGGGGGGGGPWGGGGGGGGGPWGGGGGRGPGGPWGNGPQGGPGGTPPDLEDILRRGQDRIRDLMPGGSMGGKGLVALLLLGVLLWLATGFYTVRPNEVGINLRFGQFTGKSGEGLRYNWPYPIGQVIKPSVTTVQRTEVGYRSGGGPRGGNRDVLEESLMLTGDGNIVDIDFDVQWQIDPARAENYVFNLQNPDGTIKSVAESAMREVIGRRQIQNILTTEQANIAQEVQAITQGALDAYGAGVRVNVVQLQAAVPPAQVREAFFDVNAAQQDAVRLQNEAQTYASRVVPEAQGQASQLIQQAEGYRERATADATGQASRFSQVYEEYRKAPDVTRQRLFLETMEKIFGGTDKVVIDPAAGGGSGVVPYLPLNELQPRRPAAGAAGQAQGQGQGATR